MASRGASFGTGERSRRLRAYALAALAVVTGSAAARPVLHEFIDLGPGDGPVQPDVTADGDEEFDVDVAPSAPSGASRAPSGAEIPAPGASAVPEPGSTFSIDRDTSQPESVGYEDPFTPTVVPYKRSVVYDAVNRDGDLVVQSAALVPVDKLARSGPHDEHFHAELELELRAGTPSPLPSVAPGSRLVLAHSEPRAPLRFSVDSAENWFVESSRDGKLALTLQVVADRRVFGSSYADASTEELARALPAVPPAIQASAREVAQMLGIGAATRPLAAVTRLTDHFRRFRPSERRPAGRGLELYRELALSGRGICRHRAYAFTVTALGLGIPTRLAMNEAHAWVEVFDGQLWHRIDLGGAAAQLEASDEGRPRHVEPRDPFAWPSGDQSGRMLAANRRDPAAAPGNGAPALDGEPGQGTAPSPEPPGATLSPAPTFPPEAATAPLPALEPLDAPAERDDPAPLDLPPRAALEPEMPGAPSPDLSAPEPLERAISSSPATVALNVGATTAQRGRTVPVTGSVQHKGRVCAGARVDITLAGAAGEAVPLGRLVTDPTGRFRGQLVIPWDAKLGPHSLMAEAQGPCGEQGRR